MNTNELLWTNLVISVISVNSWPIEMSRKISDKLIEEELTEPHVLASHDVIEIGNRLKKAGYDRGSLSYMIAERLISFAKKVCDDGEESYVKALDSSDIKVIENKLLSLPGIGPKVVKNYLSLVVK